MKKYGLIGFPLEHSFSKRYFTEKFEKESIKDCRYDTYPIEKIDLLKDLVNNDRELMGLNVTIPFKKNVIPLLDEVDSEAGIIGAVNTIKIFRISTDEYSLKGYNTDIYGFETPLLKVLRKHHKNALILGTGGASKAVAFILKKHSIAFHYVSRKPKEQTIFSYEDLNEEIIHKYQIIINTSPAGMYPDIHNCPDIPYQALNSDYILYDLIYNPEKTLFLQKGEEKSVTIINGLPMLYTQAEKAWEIWNR